MFLIASGLLAACAYRSLLFWEPGSDHVGAVEAWFFLPTNTSPKVIFALAAALAYRRREAIRQALSGRASPTAAMPSLLAGFALYLWGIYTDATDLLLASFVLVAFGACLLRAGGRLARALSFPLLVLLFAIPLPAILTNQLFYALQLWAARDAATLLPLLGVPVFREGNAIYGAHGQFQVVDTCAGLRFIEVLTLLAVAFAGWSPAGRLRTALRIALALPIAYVFNLLRVCLLILHPASPLSSMHIVQGWAVFLGAVTCLAYLDRLVLRHLPRRPRSASIRFSSGYAPDAEDPPPVRWAAVLPVLFAAMLGAWFWLPRWELPREERFTPVGLPVEIDGWRMQRALTLDETFLGSVGFTMHVYRPFARAGETIFVFVGYDDRTHRTRSFLTPKNAFIDAGWEVEERRFLQPEASRLRVESVLARSRQRRLLSHVWYASTGALYAETFRALLALDQSPLRRRGAGRVVRLSAPVGPEAEGVAGAGATRLALGPGSWPSRPLWKPLCRKRAPARRPRTPGQRQEPSRVPFSETPYPK
jgi:EpsI family protein